MPTRCWRCGHAIDDLDRYCRACGEGQGPSLAWYYRPIWIVLLALTVLGPFALVLVMRTPRLGAAGKWALALVLVAFFLWFGLALWRDTRVLLDLDVREVVAELTGRA